MAISIMANVFNLPLEPMSKLILLSLADNANDDGICWPSQATIGRRASISERSLRNQLHQLVSGGWISVLTLGNGRGNATKYLLNTSQIKAEADAALKAAKAEAGDIKAEVGALKAEAASRRTVIEPSIESSITTTTAREAEVSTSMRAVENLLGSLTKTVGDAVLSELDDGTSAEWIVAACDEAALANVRNWKYAAAILARWRVDGFKADRRERHATNGIGDRASGARGGGTQPGKPGGGVDPAFAKYADNG